jgi:hypothetical protein
MKIKTIILFLLLSILTYLDSGCVKQTAEQLIESKNTIESKSNTIESKQLSEQLPEIINRATPSPSPTYKIIAESTTSASSQQTLLPKPVIFSLKEGKSYTKARKVLMNNRWQPINNYSSLSIYDRKHYVVKKLGFYELETCSGTGVGYCNFLFKGRGKQILVVTTYNNQEEDHGGPKISGWRLELEIGNKK